MTYPNKIKRKLSPEQVIGIFLDPREYCLIADDYDTPINNVVLIKNRGTWYWLTKDLPDCSRTMNRVIKRRRKLEPNWQPQRGPCRHKG